MFLGTLFWDVSDKQRAWLSGVLEPGEAIVGLRETGTDDRGFGVPLALMVTTQRNALVAYDPARDTGAVHSLPTEAPTKRETSLTRVKYLVRGEERFDINRLTSGDLDALFEFAFEPRARMLYLAAQAHGDKRRWNDADALLVACGEAVDDDAGPTSEGYMAPAQEVMLLRSVVAAHRGAEDLTIELLKTLSSERPEDDLVAAGQRSNAPDDWWMMLALAHEEAGDAKSAAVVYERLQGEHDDADVFVLARARNLRDAGDVDGALAAYDTFIGSRDEDFRLVASQAESAESLEESGGRLDVATIQSECAVMLQSAGRNLEAVERWVGAIRSAPFKTEGYEGLFGLVPELGEDELVACSWSIEQASEVMSVVMPRLSESMEERGVLPQVEPRRPWESAFAPLDAKLHDEVLVHPGERASASLAQRWTAALLNDERDVSGIARHAQPAQDPVVEQTVAHVSAMLGIDAPKVFLSHGANGIDVLDRSKPFVLLGAAHTNADSDLYLGDRGLAFAVGTQLEHIRAGHLLLTSSEFWKTFGTKSMTAVLAFVPMGDLLGKLTDGAVLKWVGKLKTGPSEGVGKMVQLVESRVNEGAGRETIQSAYSATLGKLRNVGLASAERDQEHLVKERLADFARCAQYTADRVGLLACGDLSDAVMAVLRLTPSFSDKAEATVAEGLAATLDERDAKGRPVHGELALRLSELMAFALSEDYRRLTEAVTP